MQKIDARGKICPLPLFYTKRKIEEMQIGDEIEVIADDPTVKDTIPRWSKEHGHEVLSIEDKGNIVRIVVRKKEDKKEPEKKYKKESKRASEDMFEQSQYGRVQIGGENK